VKSNAHDRAKRASRRSSRRSSGPATVHDVSCCSNFSWAPPARECRRRSSVQPVLLCRAPRAAHRSMAHRRPECRRHKGSDAGVGGYPVDGADADADLGLIAVRRVIRYRSRRSGEEAVGQRGSPRRRAGAVRIRVGGLPGVRNGMGRSATISPSSTGVSRPKRCGTPGLSGVAGNFQALAAHGQNCGVTTRRLAPVKRGNSAVLVGPVTSPSCRAGSGCLARPASRASQFNRRAMCLVSSWSRCAPPVQKRRSSARRAGTSRGPFAAVITRGRSRASRQRRRHVGHQRVGGRHR